MATGWKAAPPWSSISTAGWRSLPGRRAAVRPRQSKCRRKSRSPWGPISDAVTRNPAHCGSNTHCCTAVIITEARGIEMGVKSALETVVSKPSTRRVPVPGRRLRRGRKKRFKHALTLDRSLTAAPSVEPPPDPVGIAVLAVETPLGAARRTQFAQQRFHMKLDGMLRDAELARDGLVAEPVADRGKNLDLARGQEIQLLLDDGIEGRPRRLRGAHEEPRGNGADRRVDLVGRGIARQEAGVSGVVAAENHGGPTPR